MSILRNLSFRRRQGRGAPSSHVPNYYINLINEIEESDKRKLAIFLDKDSSTTSLLVFLYCVNHLSKRFPKYMKEFAEKRWQLGDRVKVLPGNHVFEYAGILERDTSFLWLKLLDKEDRRTLPIKEIARLEKTESKRPKGTFKTPFPDQDRSPQDMVLGPDVATYGNLDIYPNIAFLLGKSSQLKVAFDSLQVKEKTFPRYFFLSEVYPFGSLSSNGRVISSDRNQTEQSPVICLSASFENISRGSMRNKDQTRTIFYDGFDKIKDLPNFAIPKNSKEILILPRRELENAQQIEEKGYTLKLYSDEEIMEGSHKEIDKKSVFYNSLRSAKNRSSLRIKFEQVEFSLIDDLYNAMIDLDEEISNSQLDDRIDQLFLSSIGLFYDFSEVCFYLPEALIDKLNLLESKIDLLKAEDNLLASFKKLIQRFKKVSEKLKVSISPKGEFINEKLKELNQKYGDDWLILSRNKISSEYVIPNSQFITMNTDENFNKLMVVGWPNKRRFEKFWHTHSSNNITFLTYSFEQELFANFFSQQEALLRRISKGTSFEGLNQYLTPIIESQQEARDREKVSRVTTKEQAEKIIERIESRLAKKENQLFSDEANKEFSIDCKMVFFSSGEAYAWVTENHHFYVLDSLLENPDSSKIPSRKLEDLEEGNFVLFRDKGDREIISLIAEESVGQQKYEELKERSQLWKEAIKSFSSPREAFNSFKSFGFKRTFQTVSVWMREESVISPEKKSDLEIINKAVSEHYQFNVDECFKAAESIRSLHITAGSTLTRYILNALRDTPPNLDTGLTKLDLDLGSVWVAELEKVLPEKRSRHISEVNNLIISDF